MKQILLLFSIFLIYHSTAMAQKNRLDTISVENDLVTPKHYIVSKTTQNLVIDGIADETAWDNAVFSDQFIDIEGIKTPKFDTKMKMLWNDKSLFIYAEMEEPHIWANLKQRDTIIFYNNDFEIFINPSGTGRNYGEIEINALNTIWDLYLDKPYSVGGNANFHWNLNDLKSAVHVYGTLNNPNDIDSLWTVEMSIPLKALIELKKRAKKIPQEGEQWRINFSRVEWDFKLKNGKYYRKKEGDNYLPEYNWVWSNQKVINMHEPEKWGVLQFTNSNSSEHIQYIKDEDLKIKQILYALFRKTNYAELKHLLQHTNGFEKDFIIDYSNQKPIKTTFYRTNFGFEYKLVSPKTQTTYLINQEGVLKVNP